tara:strand:+ start:366 stop:1559 length:1194 start_codon:yes stop_codon:yes gene_type:complete
MPPYKHKVAIIGCGRMGQKYAYAYSNYPDTKIVAIAESNEERRKIVGEKFGVQKLYPNAHELLEEVIPDIAAIITPTKFYKEAVIACAQAGVKAISIDKPIAAKLSDADEMVELCKSKGIIFAGGNLAKAGVEIQEISKRINEGIYGELKGASIHSFGNGEISGGGCQQILVLELLANSEIEEVICWGTNLEINKKTVVPQHKYEIMLANGFNPTELISVNQANDFTYSTLNQQSDNQIMINGHFKMRNGLQTSVFGTKTPNTGVDVWSENSMISWNWGSTEIYHDFDKKGNRVKVNGNYVPYKWNQFGNLAGSTRSLIKALETGSTPWVTGSDLRHALEVAIASKLSAKSHSTPIKLPLKNRSVTLYPSPYRWYGGDNSGLPQSSEDAKRDLFPKR